VHAILDLLILFETTTLTLHALMSGSSEEQRHVTRRHLTSVVDLDDGGGDRQHESRQWGEIRPGPVKSTADCRPAILPTDIKKTTMAFFQASKADLTRILTSSEWMTK
jgi:hypothetical protein